MPRMLTTSRDGEGSDKVAGLLRKTLAIDLRHKIVSNSRNVSLRCRAHTRQSSGSGASRDIDSFGDKPGGCASRSSNTRSAQNNSRIAGSITWLME